MEALLVPDRPVIKSMDYLCFRMGLHARIKDQMANTKLKVCGFSII